MDAEWDKVKLDNPELYLSSHTDKLIILNEIQRIPELFQNLRGIIDKGRREGKGNSRFFLLGSASVDLLKQSGESLAGRISFVELGPFNILEFQDDLDLLWCRGGLSK